MSGFIGRSGRVFSNSERAAMFSKPEQYRLTDFYNPKKVMVKKAFPEVIEEEPNELRMSDKLEKTFIEEGVVDRKPDVILRRPEILVFTGSKGGGSVGHLNVYRDFCDKKIVVMDDNGEVSHSYEFCQ